MEARCGAVSDGRSRVAGEAPAAAPEAAAAPALDAADLLYDVRGNLSLLCKLPNNDNLDYVWYVYAVSSGSHIVTYLQILFAHLLRNVWKWTL